MKPEHERVARGSLLLSSAPKVVVDSLLERATVAAAGRGMSIVAQHDPADAIHVALDGWGKLLRIAPPGTEAVVGVFPRSHSFGEAVVLRAPPTRSSPRLSPIAP